MSFSAEWLALREPIDEAARNKQVLQQVGDYFDDKNTLRVTDIACGTGSTTRALDGVLKPDIAWHLIDNDENLLRAARQRLQGFDASFTELDLSQNPEKVFEDSPDLIATSAFLDLVSKDWIETFSDLLTCNETAFYAALSYDGRVNCEPVDMYDGDIFTAFNTHQKTDKGLGPALGPDGVETMISLLEERGFEIVSGTSDWQTGNGHKEFQIELMSGWRQSAAEIDPARSTEVDNWFERRLDFVSSDASALMVGHLDFLAIPPQ